MATLLPSLTDPNKRIDQLIRPELNVPIWLGAEITYWFPTTLASLDYARDDRGVPLRETLIPVETAGEQGFIRLALRTWDDLIKPNFREVPKPVNSSPAGVALEFGYFKVVDPVTNFGVAEAIAYSVGLGAQSGSVWMSAAYKQVVDSGIATTAAYTEFMGTFVYRSTEHEIGHALGLSHPGNYNGTVSAAQVTYREDSNLYTIMSYNRQDNDWANGAVEGGKWLTPKGVELFSQTPMTTDIAAIQKLYGASTDTRLSNTTYGFNSAGSFTGADAILLTIYDFSINKYPILTLYDNGGEDTLDLSGFDLPSRVDLRSGFDSDTNGLTRNIWIYQDTKIENATGGRGNDVLGGNELANRLRGGDGNDQLSGFDGNDTLDGGNGSDKLDGGNGDDLALFAGSWTDYSFVLNDAARTGRITHKPTGAVDDVSGIERFQFGSIVYSWLQLATGDQKAPEVAGSVPGAGATSIALGANIVFTFSEPVFANGGYIRISTSTSNKLLSVTDAQVQLNGNTLTIDLASDLLPSTQYRVELDAGLVKDAAGNLFSGLLGSKAPSFTTGAAADTAPPTLIGYSPAIGSTALAVSTNLVLTFSEPVQRGNGAVTIRYSDGQLAQSIRLDSNEISVNGSVVTINPATDLAPGRDYYLEIAAGVFKDLAFNNFGGLGARIYTFGTARQADDFGNDTGSTGTVAVGTARREGVIEASGDVDYFRVDLVAGSSYTFALNSGSASGLGDPLLKLVSSSGQLLAQDDNSGGAKNAQITFTATTGGAYWLVAGGSNGSTGAYGLSATVADRTAPLLLTSTPADNATGVAWGADLKLVFSEPVSAAPGGLITLLLADGTVERRISVTDASQVTVSGSTVTINPATDLKAGTAYIVNISAGAFRDAANNDYAGISGNSTLNFSTTAAADDYGNDPGTQETVTVGGSARTGVIEVSGDADLFKVALTAGVTYLLDLVPGSSNGLTDPLLMLYDAVSGEQLVRSSEGGEVAGGARISFMPTVSGSYYLRAADTGGGIGNYALSAKLATDDLPGSTATGASVTVNGSAATGVINVARDADMFKVTLTAGQTYRFDLAAAASGGLADPFLVLHGPTGERLASDDNSGPGGGAARISWTATTSGTYYLAAWDAFTGTGAYTLSAAIAGSVDTTLPQLLGLNPADNASAISRERDLLLNFSEPMKAGNGQIVLKQADGTTVASFNASDTARVRFNGTVVSIDLGLEMKPLTGYYLTVAPGALLDLAGNAYAGFSASSAYNFTTAADDVSGRPGTSATVAVGSSASGRIEAQGDQDAFKVSLVAGTRYVFDLKASGSGGLADPVLALFDPTTAPITSDSNSGGGTAARIVYTATTTGTYYLLALDAGSGIGDYQLLAAKADTTAPLLVSTAPADNATNVAVGANLVLTFNETIAAGSGTVNLYNGSGTLLRSINIGDSSQVSFSGSVLTVNPSTDLAAGSAYYVTLSAGAVLDAWGNAFAGFSTSTAFNFNTAGTSDDFAFGTGTTGVVASTGAARPGVLEVGGDKDLFRIDMVAGRTYAITLNATGSTGLKYPALDLFDGQLTRLAGDTGGGSKSAPTASVIYVAPTTGSYYIGASDTSNGTGSYQISAVGVVDDQRNDRSTTGVVLVDKAGTSANIQYSQDIDYFKVDLLAGTTYTFQMDRASSGGLLASIYLSLYSPSGEWLGNGATSGSGPSVLSYTPNSNGSFYLAASAGSNQTGQYTVSAKSVNDDYPFSMNTTGLLTVGGAALNGNIGVGSDRDVFKVVLVAGKSYQFDLVPTATGGVKDAYLYLYGIDGKYLTSDDDSGHTSATPSAARITYTVATSGTYYLGAADDSNGTGNYTIRATSVIDVVGPKLETVVPADDSTDVARRRDFIFTFDEPVKAGAGNVLLYLADGTLLTAIPATDPKIRFADRTMTVDTGYELATRGAFYFNISAGAVVDLAGNAYAGITGSTALNFTVASDDHSGILSRGTAIVVDGAAMLARIEVPYDNDAFAVSLKAGGKYVFELSSSGSGALPAPYLQLYDGSFKRLAFDDSDGGSKSGGGRAEIVFTAPTTATYYLDVADYGSSTGSYQLKVTAADITGPLLQTVSPTDNATKVARGANLVMTFNEPVAAGIGFITINNSTGTLAYSIPVSDGDQVSFSGNTVTINVPGEFAGGAKLNVTMPAGVIVDAAGNAYAGIGSSGTWNFDVAPLNRNPSSFSSQASTDEDKAVSGKLPAATDPDGDKVSYTLAENARNGTVVVKPDGSFTYQPNANHSGQDDFVFGVIDGLGGAATYRFYITLKDLPDTFTGTEGNDSMKPYPGRDTYNALGGNDRIEGGPGNDTINGGLGLDTAVYSGNRSAYTTVKSGDTWLVNSASQGNDTLTGVERLAFDDRKLAFDLNASAGLAARAVGAVYGPSYVQDALQVGKLLVQLDAGKSYNEVLASAIADPLFLQLAGSRSNETLVKWIYANAVGSAPTASDTSYFVGLLSSGQISAADFAQAAAESPNIADRIDLVGLTNTGLEYVG